LAYIVQNHYQRDVWMISTLLCLHSGL